MTPQLAASVTIHEPDVAEIASTAGRFFAVPRLVSSPACLPGDRPELDEGRLPALWRRESLHRRLVGIFDVAGAALALVLVLGLTSDGLTAATAAAGTLLIVLLFKLAGLYDRDQLRIVHSTLDELPLLLQLTGLYVLGVTILQSVAVQGSLGGAQIAALWAATLLAVAGGRTLARFTGGRVMPVERCLVIGARARAERIREKLASSGARTTVVATFPLEGADDGDYLDEHSMRRIVGDLRVHRIVIAPTTTD